MSFRFASLGSGSQGNASLIESGDQRILVDCGFTLKSLSTRLASLSLSINDLSGVFISHEHIDHVRGLAALVRKCALPVWMSQGTWSALKDQKFPTPQFIHGHDDESAIALGDLRIAPLTVPHDAREPTQFIVTHTQGQQLAILTDLGRITRHVKQRVSQADALILECNHDLEMLQQGSYPPSLKRRIRSGFGHLGNDCAAQFMQQFDSARLQHLALGHLSEANNTPDLAYQAIAPTVSVDTQTRIRVLDQHQPSDWMVVA